MSKPTLTLLTGLGVSVAVLAATPQPACAAKNTKTGYTVYHSGDATDVVTTPRGGQLLSGGGIDDPAAMAWLLSRGGLGRDGVEGKVDVVVLDAYGPDIYGAPFMAWGADSVDAFIFSSRDGAYQPEVLDAIARAEVIWLDGGDQSNYIAYWAGTPLQAAIDARVAAGAAFGGMSAGLAVQGGWIYSAENGSATSAKVLANPYDRNVTLRGELFQLPYMDNVLTDTHFKVRDRMGRLLGFLARIDQDLRPGAGTPAPRAIAVDEDSSVGIDLDGNARLFGVGGGAWFADTAPVAGPRTIAPKVPLTYGGVEIQRMSAGDTFNVVTWTGTGLDTYSLSATDGVLTSSAGGAVY